MKVVRAILTGVLLWVLIFFEVSILMFGFDLEYPNTTYLIITYILLLVFIIISSLVYFRGHNVKAGLGQGIWLGIIFILVGMVLDAIITIPLFMNFDYSFLIRGNILIGSAVILVVCSVVGLLKK